jgi:hypothetical protein
MDAGGRKVARFVAFAVIVVAVVWFVSLKREDIERRNLGQAKQDVATKTNIVPEQKDFYAEYRMTRDKTRSQQFDLYREIINNANAEASARKEANQVFLKMTDLARKRSSRT